MSTPPSGQFQPYDPSVANYPRNLWWVAARSGEVDGDTLLARRLLDTDIVLYRLRDGSVAAMDDRCMHRGLPLSMGWREGDEIVCRYHGFKYSPQGKIVQIPTQENCPKRAALRTYPVVEKAPFIWIWMGDPAQADPAKAPEYPWLNDPSWVWAGGYMHVKSNYMLLKENVLDLTHFPFTHKTTFGALDDYDEAAPNFVQENGTVSFVKEFNNQALSPIYDKDLNLGGKPVDRTDKGTSMSPAEHLFTASVYDRSPPPGERGEYTVHFQHLTTPETSTTHHYWWAMSRDYGVSDAAAAWMESVAKEAFAEDKVVLEAIQQRINDSPAPRELPEVSAVADRAGLLARRQLQAYLEREAAQEA